MLSENLQALVARLKPYREGGIEISSKGVELFVALLEAAVEDAEALEASVVPPVPRLDELPPNVIRIAQVLNRQGVRLGAGPRDGGGGRAA